MDAQSHFMDEGVALSLGNGRSRRTRPANRRIITGLTIVLREDISTERLVPTRTRAVVNQSFESRRRGCVAQLVRAGSS